MDSSDNIIVEVKDAIASTIAPNLTRIAAGAKNAHREVVTLQRALASLQGTNLASLLNQINAATSAQNNSSHANNNAAASAHSAAIAAAQLAAAQSRAAKAAADAAAAQARLATETARTAAAQSRAALAAQRLQEAQERAARAAAAAAAAAAGNNRPNSPTPGAGGGGSPPPRDANGRSAGQNAAALAGLPAQITDIIVSLQGGQHVLTVLLQQGGQLRDMFGGIAAAVKALVNSVLNAITPLRLLGAALAVLGFAAIKGTDELIAFQKQSTLTGDAIGVSASRFREMQTALTDVGTKGKAAQVLTEIAAAGSLVGTQVENMARAAVLMEKAYGKAIGETVNEFKRLADEPVKASVELNKTYNYLTLAVYDQIRALEKQKDMIGAAELAEKTYADALVSRAKTAIDNAGYIEKAWRGVTNTAKEAWDAMLGVGRDVALSEKISRAEKQLANMQNDGGFGDPAKRKIAEEQLKAQLEAYREAAFLEHKYEGIARERQATEKAAITAQEEIARLTEQTASKQDQLNKALHDYRKNLEAIKRVDPKNSSLDPATVAKTEANIRDKYKESGAKASNRAEETRATALAKINLQLDNQIRLMTTLGDHRDKDETLNRIEEGLAGRRIKLNEQERESIKAKIAAIVDGGKAAAEYGRIYEEINAPLERYSATLSATATLLAQGKISQEQANAQSQSAMEKYQQAINPLHDFNKELEQSAKLRKLHGDSLADELRVMGLVEAAKAKNKPLADEEISRLRETVALERERNTLRTAEADLIAGGLAQQGKGASTQIKAIGNLKASGEGGFSAGDATNARNSMLESMGIDPSRFQSTLDAQLEAYKTYNDRLDEMKAAGLIKDQEYADARTQIELKRQKLELQSTSETLTKLEELQSSSSKELQAIGKAAAIANTTMKGIEAVQVALASAPPPMNYVNAAAVGVVAAANVAKLAGFEKGGYTGDVGRQTPAGIVHGKEFVMNAQATARNRAALETMNAGGSMPTGAAPVTVIVNNNASGTRATTEEREGPSGKELIVTISEVVSRDIRQGGRIADSIESQYGVNRATGTMR